MSESDLQRSALTAHIAEVMVSTLPYLCVSQSGNVIAYNDAFSELVEVGGDLHGLSIERAFTALSSLLPLLQTILSEDKEFRSRLIHFERDHHFIHLLIDAKKISLMDDMAGWLLICRNIENIGSFETQIIRNDKLATAGKFAAGVAHEIRNPLTSVRGFLQILQSRFIADKMTKEQSYAALMIDEIDRVNQLVNKLLLFSKPTAFSFEKIHVDEVIQSIAPVVQSHTEQNGISFVTSLQSTPPVLVDREMLKQVLLNLIGNAIEAMEEGGSLTVATKYDEGGAMVHIDVSDTGPGIPYYMLDRIFDAFFTTKEIGIGLGLPICQRIVTDQGGDIRVYTKGYGTTFSVRLPSVAGE